MKKKVDTIAGDVGKHKAMPEQKRKQYLRWQSTDINPWSASISQKGQTTL